MKNRTEIHTTSKAKKKREKKHEEDENSEMSLQELEREALEECEKNNSCNNEFFPKITYDKKIEFPQIHQTYNTACSENNKLAQELAEVLSFFYFVKYRRPEDFNKIKEDMIIISLFEHYYVQKRFKLEKTIDMIIGKLLQNGIPLGEEGIKRRLKRFRKNKLTRYFGFEKEPKIK